MVSSIQERVPEAVPACNTNPHFLEEQNKAHLNEDIILIITRTGYPFGGGEDFLRQTIDMNMRLGMRTVWLSFCDKHQADHAQTLVGACDQGLVIQQSGGWNLEAMTFWILYLHPLVVHTQGPLAADVVELCAELNVPSMVGIHFWTGVITLSSDTCNQEILKHVTKHRPAPSFKTFQKKATQLYVASTFVLDVMTAVCGPVSAHVVNPCPLPEKCLRTQSDGHFVTLINCHHLKGGSLLLQLISQCPDIKFLAVKTEDGSSKIDEALKETRCRLLDHVEDVREIYNQTRVLLIPSLVDETFGRVMAEAMLNGIPMLTTGAGNLRTFLQDAPDLQWLIIPTHDVDMWAQALSRLLQDSMEYARVSQRLKDIYQSMYQDRALEPYRQVIAAAIPKPCIMFYTTWSDQGLGIQARSYVRILEAHGYQTCVLSFCSYTGTHTQVTPLEWEHPRVTYSTNHRERVTDEEIRTFVSLHKPTCCIIPETVYHRVFEIAWLLQTLNIYTIAIPNVEIVRREELHKHHAFDLVLFNNHLCEKVFRDRHFNGHQAYLGFGLPTRSLQLTVKTGLHFLCLGGLNAFFRKNVNQVAEAFLLADIDAKLTITIQSGNQTQGMHLMPVNSARMNIITDALDTKQVDALYAECDCLVQVSRHEGLGLGFFEAHSWGLPCITLDTPPHNEIYSNETGWLLPVVHQQAVENTSSHITEACFQTASLVDAFKKVHAIYLESPTMWLARRERLVVLNETMAKTFETHFVGVVENAHSSSRLFSRV